MDALDWLLKPTSLFICFSDADLGNEDEDEELDNVKDSDEDELDEDEKGEDEDEDLMELKTMMKMN